VIEPTLKFDGQLDIGAFTVGGVAFDETQLKVHLDEAAGVNEVSFSGGFTIFGNGVKVLGALKQAGETTSASLEVQQVGAISVDGFTLEDMRFSAAVEVGPGVNKVSISAAGKVNILGQMLNVREFKVAIDNGVVEDVSFDIQAKIDIADVATADGEFQMSYSESTGDFQLHAKVALTTAAGFKNLSPRGGSVGFQDLRGRLRCSLECRGRPGSVGLQPAARVVRQANLKRDDETGGSALVFCVYADFVDSRLKDCLRVSDRGFVPVFILGSRLVVDEDLTPVVAGDSQRGANRRRAKQELLFKESCGRRFTLGPNPLGAVRGGLARKFRGGSLNRMAQRGHCVTKES
jgi:hypothetical protein